MCNSKISFYKEGVNILRRQTIKRQSLDFLLTDLLPYEKGNHYTHVNFYKYLLEADRKKEIKRISREMKVEKGKIFSSDWHSAPLDFFTTKRKGSFRKLSLINPVGLIESFLFIDIFQNDILNILKAKKHFSIRIPNHNNNLYYKNTEGDKVKYSQYKDGKQILLSLESSGDYFKHRPIKTITRFLRGKQYNDCLNSYDYLLKIDIQKFFDSIYTHSYKWVIASKTYDSKKMKESSSIFSNIDTFLQNLNGSKTNGILVGPELFRLLAEFLLVQIDELLLHKLNTYSYIASVDYEIFRYIDDYFIFTNDKVVEKNIHKELEYLLNRFQLSINPEKIVESDTAFNDDYVWLVDIVPIVNSLLELINPISIDIEKTIGDIIDDLEEEVIGLERDVLEKIIRINLKQNKSVKTNYQVLRNQTIKLLKSSNETSLVTSYILTTVLRQLENSDEIQISSMENFVQYLIFVYAHNITYDSTQKLIQIFKMLLVLDEPNVVKEYISASFEQVSRGLLKIFVRDWIDLLLFISAYDIPITNHTFVKIKNNIYADKDPVNVAAFAIAADSMAISGKIKISNEINQMISLHVDKINWDRFSEDELNWWVYIFYSYPGLKPDIREKIKSELEIIKETLLIKHPTSIYKRQKELENEKSQLKEERIRFTEEMDNNGSDQDRIKNFNKTLNLKLKENTKKLNEVEKNIYKDNFISPSDAVMLLVVNYILDEKVHFVEWRFSKENYHEQFYFYTTDRTKFNPRGGSNDSYR